MMKNKAKAIIKKKVENGKGIIEYVHLDREVRMPFCVLAFLNILLISTFFLYLCI